MIMEAHRRGLRTTGHCAHQLPLVAAGIDAKEHIGLCAPRGDSYMYDDLIQLLRAADIGVVPTISYLSFVHMELVELVAAGLSPVEAIRAGSGAAARILGADKDLGTIEVGKWADLIILDANPLADIRNTRRIWQVVHNGRIVDRHAILEMFRQE
jgi:hypothetical protein